MLLFSNHILNAELGQKGYCSEQLNILLESIRLVTE